MIDGNLQSQNAVKYFKWLSLPIVPQNSTRIITPEQVQKSMKIMKDRVQDGVHDVWEQVAPVSPTKNYYTPPKRRQPANFINNLPDLRN